MKKLTINKKTYLISSLVFVVGLLAMYQVVNSQDASDQNGSVTVEGSIDLVPEGDQNKNSEIDAGDIVAFRFDIVNKSKKEYSFAELQTGIDKNLYFDFWNLRGTANMSDDNNTITFPNLLVPPESQVTIGVEATVKYFTTGEKQLSVSPELVDKEKKKVGEKKDKEKSRRNVRAFEGKLPPWMATDNEFTEPETSSSPQPSASVAPEPTAKPSTSPSPGPSLEPSPTPSISI